MPSVGGEGGLMFPVLFHTCQFRLDSVHATLLVGNKIVLDSLHGNVAAVHVAYEL